MKKGLLIPLLITILLLLIAFLNMPFKYLLIIPCGLLLCYKLLGQKIETNLVSSDENISTEIKQKRIFSFYLTLIIVGVIAFFVPLFILTKNGNLNDRYWEFGAIFSTVMAIAYVQAKNTVKNIK